MTDISEPDGRSHEVALVRCYAHKGLAVFTNLDGAVSVWVDVATRLPADHPDATPGLTENLWEARDRGLVQREPICESCLPAFNRARQEKGLDPVYPLPS